MKRKNRQYNNLLAFILVLLAAEAILFYVNDARINHTLELDNERLAAAETTLSAVPVLAKAVSVYDVTKSEKLYGKNDTAPLALASLAKIMTIITALNAHALTDTITISPAAIAQDGDYGLFINEKWKVEDLARATLIVSSNDGAYAFSESVPDFLDKVNQKAKAIGVETASFVNPTGLDLPTGQASDFASAADVNLMAAFAYEDYPSIFGTTVLPEITVTSLSGFKHTFENTDTILDKIPNLLFSKTGYTDAAGGNLCVIFTDKAGEEIAVTVLGSTFDGRFTDMQKLVDAVNTLN